MRALAFALSLTLASCATPPPPPPGGSYLEDNRREWVEHSLGGIFDQYGFEGGHVISGGLLDGHEDKRALVWPWASVTKQVLAVLVMQQVENGRLALDAPVTTYWPDWPTAFPPPTVRQLLQHQSGLANPDDAPHDANGFPSAYAEGLTEKHCLIEMSPPGGEQWRYNNCDYLMLGALLEQVSGTPLPELIRTRIAEPSGWTDTRLLGRNEMRDYVARSEVTDLRLSGYGASGALVGPLSDMIAFDRALMDGGLLSEASRDVLWQGNPSLGFMALGQWSFEAPIRGCEAPVRIIERRGGIGDYQVRNIILPDKDIAVAFATADGDFDFGEIWTGQGFLHEALWAIACR